ncbi:MAG: 30S ribosomal protein S12 methylthiotransferase RimO [Anaerovoracaceae bacterium]
MKIYMETMGCPKNFYDTQTAKGILSENGFDITEEIEEADIMVINTCGFINDAKKESIERIFELAQYKEDGKKLIVSGCLSERYHRDLMEEMPEADAFIGVNEYQQLPEIITEISKKTDRADYVSGCAGRLGRLPRILEGTPYSATLKIAEGCNNRCAYCVIPDIRGPFRSKSMEDVTEEARWLAENGCKELILIAQDVTYYGYDLYGKLMLPDLLKRLCAIDGIRWIRLMYCYEDRITDQLIDVIKTEKKICDYIDIPIQHASDRILKAMRRRSTSGSIRSTINRLKEAIPDIHIRTTFITGFPGETEEDFDQLLQFAEEMEFARLGVFAYSQEENTPAGQMEEQVPEEIRAERADAVMRAQMDISLRLNRKKIGKVFEVLVEEKDDDGSYIGRTAYDAPEIDDSVIFTSERDLAPGDMVNVLIQDAFDYDLTGMEV